MNNMKIIRIKKRIDEDSRRPTERILLDFSSDKTESMCSLSANKEYICREVGSDFLQAYAEYMEKTGVMFDSQKRRGLDPMKLTTYYGEKCGASPFSYNAEREEIYKNGIPMGIAEIWAELIRLPKQN